MPTSTRRSRGSTAETARWKVALPSGEALQRLKREAVVREAGRAFRTKGFHRTSLDEVAEALNVTKAALYYYVKGKRELLYETQSLALDMGDEALAFGALGRCGREKLERTISKYILLSAYEFQIRAGIEDMLPEHQEVIRARVRRFDQQVRAFIQEGAADGSIAPCDPKLAVSWLMGSVNYIPHWLKNESKYGAEEIARSFVHFMVHGLSAAEGAAKPGAPGAPPP